MMDRGDWERAAAIYGPLLAAVVLRMVMGRRPKQFAACLLGILWALPSLVVVQGLNVRFGWWRFGAGSAVVFHVMPLELWVGWVLLWGVVPQMVVPRLGVWRTAGLMVGLDCLGMPLCTASVQLGPWWLVGETVAVGLVLLPALLLGDWTRRGVRVRWRAGMQVAIAAGLFLYLVPEVIFAARPGVGWVGGEIWFELAFCLAVPGLSAVMEFAARGGGTPIPYDPPSRLVTTGVYRYVANPMQLSCALVMLVWACMMRSGWMAVAAGIAVIYSAGIAAWDEGDDLRGRFGEEWVQYRGAVRDWWPRWRPYCAGEDAVVYIARGCEPCSAVRRWLEARRPLGLRIVDAQVLPQGSIRRMRYVGADGVREDGVRAFARALEHVHLGWCWLGMTMRLPGVWWGLQVVMDACGLGEREICAAGMVRK